MTYPSRKGFLGELILDPPEATSDETGVPPLDNIILSTIHSDKGREWTTVTLLNAVDGRLASDLTAGSSAEIEEERRRLYVGMTRARDHLDIASAIAGFMPAGPASSRRTLHTSRLRLAAAGA